MNAGIEVKRARVRALAWRLISNPSKDFNLANPCHCSIGEASGMAEFQAVGARRYMTGYGEEFASRLNGRGFLNQASKFFGLSGQYFSIPDDASPGAIQFATGTVIEASRDSRRIGIWYLEAIGDTGPPERITQSAREPAKEYA